MISVLIITVCLIGMLVCVLLAGRTMRTAEYQEQVSDLRRALRQFGQAVVDEAKEGAMRFKRWWKT